MEPKALHTISKHSRLPHLSHSKEALLRGHIENFERFAVMTAQPQQNTRRPMPLPLGVVPLQSHIDLVPHPPHAEASLVRRPLPSTAVHQPASAPTATSGRESLAARIVGEMNVAEASMQLAAMVKVLIAQEMQKKKNEATGTSLSELQRAADVAQTTVTIPTTSTVQPMAVKQSLPPVEKVKRGAEARAAEPGSSKPPRRSLDEGIGARVIVSGAGGNKKNQKRNNTGGALLVASPDEQSFPSTATSEHVSPPVSVVAPKPLMLPQKPPREKRDVVITNAPAATVHCPPASSSHTQSQASSHALAPAQHETVGSIIIRAHSPQPEQSGAPARKQQQGNNSKPRNVGSPIRVGVYKTPLSSAIADEAPASPLVGSPLIGSPVVISIPSVESIRSPASAACSALSPKKSPRVEPAPAAEKSVAHPSRNQQVVTVEAALHSPIRSTSPQSFPHRHHPHPDLAINVELVEGRHQQQGDMLGSVFAHSPRYAPSPAVFSPKGSPRVSPQASPRASPRASPLPFSRHGSTSDIISSSNAEDEHNDRHRSAIDVKGSMLPIPTATRIEPVERPLPPRSPSHYRGKGGGGDGKSPVWSMQEDYGGGAGESFDQGGGDALGPMPSVVIQEASTRGDDTEQLLTSPRHGDVPLFSTNSSPRLRPALASPAGSNINVPPSASNQKISSPPLGPGSNTTSGQGKRYSGPPSPYLPPAAAGAKAFSLDPLTLAAQIERDRLKAAYEPELAALREKQAQLATAIGELEKAIAQANALEQEAVQQRTVLEKLDEEGASIVKLMKGVYECITFCKTQIAQEAPNGGTSSSGSSEEHSDDESVQSQQEMPRTKSALVPMRAAAAISVSPSRTRVQSTVAASGGGSKPMGSLKAGGPQASPARAGASLGIGTSLRLTAGMSGGFVSPGGKHLPSPRQTFLNARTPSPGSVSAASHALGSPPLLSPQLAPRTSPGAMILRGGRSPLAPERKRKEEDADMLRLLEEARAEHESVSERLAQDIAILVDRGRELLLGDTTKDRRGKGGKKGGHTQSTLQNALATALADNSSSSSAAFTMDASSSAGSKGFGTYSDDDLIAAAILEDIGLEIADFQAHRDTLRSTLRTVEGELQILLAQLQTMASGAEEDKFELAKQLLTVVDDETIVKPDVQESPAGTPPATSLLDGSGESERNGSLFEIDDYDISERAGFRELRNAATQVNEEDIRRAIAALAPSVGFSDLREDDAMDDIYRHERLLSQLIHHMMVAVANITLFHANLEVESTCKQCLKLFQDPRTLWPCGHTFCGSCMPQLTDADGNIVCSECLSPSEMGHIAHPTMELLTNYQRMNLMNAAALGGPSSGASPTKEKSLFATLEQLAADLAQAKDGFEINPITPARSPVASPRALAGKSAFSPFSSPQQRDLIPSAASSPGAPSLMLPPNERRGTMQFVQ